MLVLGLFNWLYGRLSLWAHWEDFRRKNYISSAWQFMKMRFTDRAHPELPGFGQFSAGCFARRQVVGSLADACACLVSGFSE